VKRFQHLVDALRGVFADIHAAAENFARGIDGDELDVVVFAGKKDAVGNFAEHGFVQEIVIWAVEGEPSDTIVDPKFYEFKAFWLATYGSSCEFFGTNRLNHWWPPEPFAAAKAGENGANSMLAQRLHLASWTSSEGAQTVAAKQGGRTPWCNRMSTLWDGADESCEHQKR